MATERSPKRRGARTAGDSSGEIELVLFIQVGARLSHHFVEGLRELFGKKLTLLAAVVASEMDAFVLLRGSPASLGRGYLQLLTSQAWIGTPAEGDLPVSPRIVRPYVVETVLPLEVKRKRPSKADGAPRSPAPRPPIEAFVNVNLLPAESAGAEVLEMAQALARPEDGARWGANPYFPLVERALMDPSDAGRVTWMARVRDRDRVVMRLSADRMEDYYRLLIEKAQRIPGVRSTETFFVLPPSASSSDGRPHGSKRVPHAIFDEPQGDQTLALFVQVGGKDEPGLVEKLARAGGARLPDPARGERADPLSDLPPAERVSGEVDVILFARGPIDDLGERVLRLVNNDAALGKAKSHAVHPYHLTVLKSFKGAPRPRGAPSPLEAYVEVEVTTGSRDLESVQAQLLQTEERGKFQGALQFLARIRRRNRLLVRLRAPSKKRFDELLMDGIQTIPQVRYTHTYLILNEPRQKGRRGATGESAFDTLVRAFADEKSDEIGGETLKEHYKRHAVVRTPFSNVLQRMVAKKELLEGKTGYRLSTGGRARLDRLPSNR